jgi:hypothetical protein
MDNAQHSVRLYIYLYLPICKVSIAKRPVRSTVHTTEPFLLMCNNTLRDYGLPVPPSTSRSLVTSKYAGITVFIIRDEGFPHLSQNFMAYGALSGATLNMHKSTGLSVGWWRSGTDTRKAFDGADKAGNIWVSVSATRLLVNTKTGCNWTPKFGQ